MSIVIFLIILAVLVLVHEFGHFIVAKKSGIRVDEFGLGFPPRLYSKKIGETTYSINLIPFGGFVKIFGENPDAESTVGPDSKRSFINKNRAIQAAVLVAGVTFNILFAWILFSIGYMTGLPSSVGDIPGAEVSNPQVVIISVAKNSPADKAILKPGDMITSLSSGVDSVKDVSVESVQNFIVSHPKEEIVMGIKRGGTAETLSVTPMTANETRKPSIGISMDVIGLVHLPFFQAFYYGGKLTVNWTKYISVKLAEFVSQAFTGRADFSEVTGPVGIVGQVKEAEALGFVYVLSFAAIISINLAIINLIPFPALDGGRLLFVWIEAIRRKPIAPKIANALNSVGFAILILLMLIVTYKDIVKLFWVCSPNSFPDIDIKKPSSLKECSVW